MSKLLDQWFGAAQTAASEPVEGQYLAEIGRGKTPQQILRDPRFIRDAREMFAVISPSKEFYSDEEVIEALYDHWNYTQINTAGMIEGGYDAMVADDATKARMGRIEKVMRMPGISRFNDGIAGNEGDAVWDIARNLIFDPVNLIPGGKAFVAGKHALKAGKSALWAGAKAGAKYDAAINAAISAPSDALMQGRDMEIGLQDEFSTGQLATSTAVGALLGGVTGGVLGGVAGAAGGRQVQREISDQAANATRTATELLERELRVFADDINQARVMGADAEEISELEQLRSQIEYYKGFEEETLPKLQEKLQVLKENGDEEGYAKFKAEVDAQVQRYSELVQTLRDAEAQSVVVDVRDLTPGDGAINANSNDPAKAAANEPGRPDVLYPQERVANPAQEAQATPAAPAEEATEQVAEQVTEPVATNPMATFPDADADRAKTQPQTPAEPPATIQNIRAEIEADLAADPIPEQLSEKDAIALLNDLGYDTKAATSLLRANTTGETRSNKGRARSRIVATAQQEMIEDVIQAEVDAVAGEAFGALAGTPEGRAVIEDQEAFARFIQQIDPDLGEDAAPYVERARIVAMGVDEDAKAGADILSELLGEAVDPDELINAAKAGDNALEARRLDPKLPEAVTVKVSDFSESMEKLLRLRRPGASETEINKLLKQAVERFTSDALNRYERQM